MYTLSLLLPHSLFVKENFDFVDDIIWVKPEGAGKGRGRRFFCDRNPLQYKPVPVTEYVLVYRKHSGRLIDWNIRQYSRDVINKSKVLGDYDRTNVWYIPPVRNPKHSAVFPENLAYKVIRYYSFVGDFVLDPFSGVGTVGLVAHRMGRKFVLIEHSKEYVDIALENLSSIGADVDFIDT